MAGLFALGAALPALAQEAVGLVDATVGEPQLIRGAAKRLLVPGEVLRVADTIETPDSAKVRVHMLDGSTLAIGGGTKIDVRSLKLEGGKRTAFLNVLQGKFWMDVRKWVGGGESFVEVQTPTAVAGVRGTTLWGDTKVDAICSLEGTVEVRNRVKPELKAAVLTAGNCAAELGQGRLTPLAPSAEAVQGYLNEVLIK